MATDDERREVAERLREIELSKGGYVAWWKIAKALKLKQLDGWFGWEKFDPDSAKRLADLIEPSEPKVKCVAEVKVDGEQLEKLVHEAVVEYAGVDRDALLALAEEMTWCYEGAASAEGDGTVGAWVVMQYADRIREALGVCDG